MADDAQIAPKLKFYFPAAQRARQKYITGLVLDYKLQLAAHGL